MTDTIAADTQAESLFILERDRRLSDSFLWSLQRRSYELQGVGAWKKEDAVPHFVTTNAFIATAYARVVLAWLRDWYAIGHSSGGEIAGLDLSRPVYIVELGSGPGRFAFLFLKNFARLHARSTVRRVPFRYVMTDLAERNLAFWREHPSLRPFVEAGVLDFARFDAEQPHELTLEVSGDVLAPGKVANPLVVLANYVFDTIRQDIFSVKGGELYEARVSVGSSQQEPDLDDPEILSRLKLSFEDFQTTPAYYGDADLDCILREYQQRLPDVSFLFPSVALRCIRYLSDLSSGRMLLLTSDKGYEREEELIDQNGPGFGAHGGTFSLVVNYHAIGRYLLHRGGQFLPQLRSHPRLSVVACLLGLSSEATLETRQAFEDEIADFGPEEFYILTDQIDRNRETMTIGEVLAWIRCSRWDTTMFRRLFHVLLKQVESAPELVRRDVHAMAQRVWEDYYYIGEDDDVATRLGMLLGEMEFYSEALTFFDRSLQLYTPTANTYYVMAVCHIHLKEWDAALERVNQALTLDPVLENARLLRLKLEAEVGRQASDAGS